MSNAVVRRPGGSAHEVHDGLVVVEATRAYLITADGVERVRDTMTGEFLPRVAERESEGVDATTVWELPSTVTSAEGNEFVDESLTLELRSPSETQELHLVVRGLPGSYSTEEPGEESPDAWRMAHTIAKAAIGRHVEFIQELIDLNPPDDAPTWPRIARFGLLRDVAAADRRWQEVDRIDEPRSALIVKIARDLSDLVRDVCMNPRVILRRTRELQPVDRIQQVDSACIRWLARQPGLSIIEKAGARQEAMSLVREEHSDTHENRVVRDFLSRCDRACSEYLAEYGSFSEHERVLRVSRFRRAVRNLRRNSPIARVKPLAGVPRTNYVLEHDRRYKPLWRAYLDLLRRQRVLDSAWRWRHRVWAESCRFLTLAALRAEPEADGGHRTDLVFHGDHDRGVFVSSSTRISAVRLANGVDATLLWSASHLLEYLGAEFEFDTVPPDFAVVFEHGENRKTVIFWGVLDFELFPSIAPRFAEAPDERARGAIERVFIVPAGFNEEVAEVDHRTVRRIRVGLPLQAGTERIAALLRRFAADLPGMNK